MNSGLRLEKNDRVVFFGDSITEQQLYSNYVETYLATRYPELNLTFFNAGWGGDTAPGGVDRLDRDVLALKPTLVTICFGMNDGGYATFTEEIRTRYVNGMRNLVTRLKAAKVRMVLLTPGMAEESVNPDFKNIQYNRRNMKILADEVLKLAEAEQLPVFDLHTLMNEVDAKAKAVDPKFCMIPDSVHPDPAGHLVMAYGLLKLLGVPPRQQFIDLDVSSGKVSSSPGIVVRTKRRRDGTVEIGLSLDHLPFFVEAAARKVLPFLPFQETFNTLLVRISGMKSSKAWLRTGNTNVLAICCEELAAGINLFDQWATLPMQAAGAVHRFTVEKDQIYYKIWRAMGLNHEKSGMYNAAAYAMGIRILPGFDRVRKGLLTRKALSFQMKLVGTESSAVPVENGDFICGWSYQGPFPKPFETDRLGGEAAFTTQLPDVGSWVPCTLDPLIPGNNLIELFGPINDCFVYLAAVIDSPIQQTAELLVGSDDGVAVWMNGESCLSHLDIARGLVVDQDRVPVSLRAGHNVILVKVSQYGGGCGVCVRFAGLQAPVTVGDFGASKTSVK